MHTLQDYTVEFSEMAYTVSDLLDTVIIPVMITTTDDTPSSSATVSFTRTDSGPAISDLDVSSVGSQVIKVQIPNDSSETNDRTFNVTMVTSDELIEIGPQSKVSIDVIEDDCKSLLLRVLNHHKYLARE